MSLNLHNHLAHSCYVQSCQLQSGTGSLVLGSPGHGVRWGGVAQCSLVGRSEHLSPGDTRGERTFANEGIRKLPEEVAYRLGVGRRDVMHRATGQRVSHEAETGCLPTAEAGKSSLWTGHASSPAVSLLGLLGQASPSTCIPCGLRAFVHATPSHGTSFLQPNPPGALTSSIVLLFQLKDQRRGPP